MGNGSSRKDHSQTVQAQDKRKQAEIDSSSKYKPVNMGAAKISSNEQGIDMVISDRDDNFRQEGDSNMINLYSPHTRPRIQNKNFMLYNKGSILLIQNVMAVGETFHTTTVTKHSQKKRQSVKNKS